MKKKYEFGVLLHKFFIRLAKEKPFEYDFAYDTNESDVCVAITKKEYEFFCEIRVPKQYYTRFWEQNKHKSNFFEISE